ncbi:hypothetical protein CCR75_003699 [Bremia lactucae]|uniref:Thioredoxin domain-containing protein n=1 Tax=Bremia lactucae TaxID=4779 RepID=A0A976IJZ0_BRELC|nr:hypothetical protein CCR75_003699 [Bremia lactucae]
MKMASLEKPQVWSSNPVRFMRLILAITMLLSLWYMWQFTSKSVVSNNLKATNANDAQEEPLEVQIDRSRAHTQYIVHGFEHAHKFVREYNVETMGPLFLLFLSDLNDNGTYWFQPCELVQPAIYRGFQRAPRRSRLLEIRVGSEPYWNDLMNPFRQNQLFYIDYLPTLMRYDGGGNSSALLAGPNCLNQKLLDVVFQTNLYTRKTRRKNRIVHYNTVRQVLDYLASYDFSYPLFLYIVSGVHAFNNRLWCPFCDKAEVPVMHYFNETATDSAVMLRIVAAREPRQWFEEDNDFTGKEFSENVVVFDGVPFLGYVGRNHTSKKIHVTEYVYGPDRHDLLQKFFQRQAPGLAVKA